MLKLKLRRSDSGFTLTETIIALGVLGVLMASLASVLSFATKANIQNGLTRDVAYILQNEVDAISVANWDDIMLAPTDPAASSICRLGTNGLRASTQTVRPRDIVVKDTKEFLVQRDVRWATAGDKVSCAVSPNDRADLKVTTITITWLTNGELNARSATVVSSRYRNPGKELPRASG